MAPVAQFNGIAGKLKQRIFLLGILTGMAFFAVLAGPVGVYSFFGTAIMCVSGKEATCTNNI
jgi:hypothetical protein